MKKPAAHISLRSEQGQTMTEFVLVLPALCLILFGIIQFGILFNNYVTLTDATRAGARKAAVSRHASSPETAAESAVRASAAGLDQGTLDVEVAVDPAWDHGSDVTVTASYPYRIELLDLVFAEGSLTSTTTERVE